MLKKRIKRQISHSNTTPDTYQPIMDMVTLDVLPKSTYLTTAHNTTHTSWTTSENDTTLSVNHDSIRQSVPFKLYHGSKTVPTLKAVLERNSTDYAAFVNTYTEEISEWELEHTLNPLSYPTHRTQVWRWVPNHLSTISRIHTMPSPIPKSSALKTNFTTTVWKWTLIKIRRSPYIRRLSTMLHHVTFTYTLTHFLQPTH